MPIPPAARTIDIKELSTVAGASFPSLPCALASKPTASTAASTSDLRDQFAQIISLGQIDRGEANLFRMLQPLCVHVTDHHQCCPQDPRRCCCSHPYGACSRDVYDRTDTNACHDRTMKSGREDIRQHGQILDLRHCLVFIRELDQIEIGVRDQHVLRLSTDPPSHIDIPIRPARATRIDVQAYASLLLTTGTATSARDIDEVADFEVLNVFASLDNFAGDFVTENHSCRRGGPASYHMLIRTADVGRDNLENDAVLDVFPGRILHCWKINRLDLDFIVSEKKTPLFCAILFSPLY
jgi:hypothetical protein